MRNARTGKRVHLAVISFYGSVNGVGNVGLRRSCQDGLGRGKARAVLEHFRIACDVVGERGRIESPAVDHFRFERRRIEDPLTVLVKERKKGGIDVSDGPVEFFFSDGDARVGKKEAFRFDETGLDLAARVREVRLTRRFHENGLEVGAHGRRQRGNVQVVEVVLVEVLPVSYEKFDALERLRLQNTGSFLLFRFFFVVGTVAVGIADIQTATAFLSFDIKCQSSVFAEQRQLL
mmetsp:Transcript_37072/g.86488  ORF Transcript_37072/g.86488 Transcript_37072/m.86488 type:complete len:234 (+) Transcript_37072:940-1641(+)